MLTIDIDSQSIIRRIPVPGEGEGAVAVSPDNRHVYFASNHVPKLFVIDSATYDWHAIDYPPGGRGCLCILAHSSEPMIYLGIQRGGRSGNPSQPAGGSFLAVYDLAARSYAGELNLAELNDRRTESAMPFCLTLDVEHRSLFVGMLGSKRGLCRTDEQGQRILDVFGFEPDSRNKRHCWIDPLSQVLYRDRLLSVNRNSRELVVLDKFSGHTEHAVYLGEAPNGPHSVAVFDDLAVVSYPDRGGLIFLDLSAVA